MLMYETMIKGAARRGQYKIIDWVKDSQVFVVTTNEDTLKEWMPSKDELFNDESDNKLDLPFPVCSFEVLRNGKQTPVSGVRSTGVLEQFLSVTVVEKNPGEWIFFTFSYEDGKMEETLQIRWIHKDDENLHEWRTIKGMVMTFLNMLKNGQHGHTTPRTIIKWKQNGEKKQTRIKKVIYIRPSSNSESSVGNALVNWSHAFWVMGHWRDISGIGKDRNGEYGVIGKTWVIPHVKNAELGDPVSKIRILNNPSRA